MKARNRRYGNGRRVALRTRVGAAAAAAALAGGGVIAAAAAASHPGAATAEPAGYSSWTPAAREWNTLNSAMSSWNWSRQSAYSQLARLTQARTFSQTWQHHQMLAVQRGIVVLATRRFLILKSANGSLHLWALSGATRFQNVSSTSSGTAALTASTWATSAAMQRNNMLPATNLLAGSTSTAAQMVAPTAATQTVTVDVANTDLKVTVIVTSTTATVSQTATTSAASAAPTWAPITYRQYAWQQTNGIARGDLALVVGFRTHWLLHARLVLFTPLSMSDVTGQPATGTTGTTGTAGAGTQSGGFSGTHS